jgi:hypothetical protein
MHEATFLEGQGNADGMCGKSSAGTHQSKLSQVSVSQICRISGPREYFLSSSSSLLASRLPRMLPGFPAILSDYAAQSR